MTSIAKTAFSYSFETSPLLLENGIAQYSVDATLPIIGLLETFFGEYFAQFRVLPGSTLEEWQVAEYPFVNLQMAANATVQMPLKVSMLMICPAQNPGGYLLKQPIITALKALFDSHVSQGGTFTVLTPAYTYINCILTSMRDVSSASDKQVQYMYQLDFVQPLVTTQAAEKVLGALMNKVANGLPTLLSNFNSAPAAVPPLPE